MYEVNGWHKFGEQAHHEIGCDPDNYVSFSGNERFCAVTIPDLLIKLRGFVGVDDDNADVSLDACDEDGRVDINVLETADGYVADKWQIEEWKRDEIPLWFSTYTFYVEEVTRRSARLLEVSDGL
jgi:hypothetical protein